MVVAIVYLIFSKTAREDAYDFQRMSLSQIQAPVFGIPRRTFPQAEACAQRRSGGGKGHGGSFVEPAPGE